MSAVLTHSDPAYRFIMRTLQTAALLCLMVPAAFSQAVPAEGVAEAWRLDFDNAAAIGGVQYVQRGTERSATGMVMQVADGVLTFGAGKDAAGGPWERAVLAWGTSMPYGFWQWPASPFQPIEVQRFPVIEVRARKAPGMQPVVCMAPVFETDSGISFTQMDFSLSDEWQDFSFRFSPLSSVPGPRTPRRVVGLTFLVQPGTGASGLQLDWIRIRGFTAQEAATDGVVSSHLRAYKVPTWKQPFFVYGPYGPSVRDTARQGGLLGAYGGIVKAHMNYVMCPHDMSYYRFQGNRANSQEQNVRDFIEVNRQAVDAAEAVGLRMSLDIRGFDKDLKAHGLEYIAPGIRQVAEAFRNSPAVVGYTAGDEPQTNRLWEIVGVKEAFEREDPTRLVAFPLADALWAPDFEPYSTIHCGDRYPILDSGRACDGVADQMDQYNVATGKPVWFIIQAFGDRPSWVQTRGGYGMPTEGEFFRMAFLALGRGVKGLLLYDWYHTPWEDLTDRYGNPGPLLGAASRLGERLAGVGSILLRCDAVRGKEQPQLVTRSGDTFEVRTLTLRSPPGALLVVCNTDIQQSHDLDLTLTRPAAGEALFDLETLTVSRDGRLRAPAVAPGDGRFFALVPEAGVATLEAEVAANRKLEAERVTRLERALAGRWADAAAEMTALDAALTSCAAKLGPLESALLVTDNQPKSGKEQDWARCVELGKRYDALRLRWITGDRAGLPTDVAALKSAVEALTSGK
jgi:hypothetical protein